MPDSTEVSPTEGTDIMPVGTPQSVVAAPQASIIPVSPADLKYHAIVQKVREKLSTDCNTIKCACAAAGVTRRLFYDAMRCPYVQAQTAAEMDARGQAAQEVLERSWVGVLMNMANIASGKNARDAVTAARLLNDIRLEAEKVIKPDKKAESNVAAELTRRFLAQSAENGIRGPIKLTETVREIEVPSND